MLARRVPSHAARRLLVCRGAAALLIRTHEYLHSRPPCDGPHPEMPISRGPWTTLSTGTLQIEPNFFRQDFQNINVVGSTMLAHSSIPQQKA
jgi:hypothetical protein